MRVLLKAGVGDFHGFGDMYTNGDCDGFGVCHADADDDQCDVDGDGDSDVCSNYNEYMISDDNNFFVLNSNNINGN